jgi:hypothetical protein
MIAKQFLSQILDDEALTRGLSDPEARMLVEWLVDQAERLADAETDKETLPKRVNRLCRKGRAISRFVGLWCHQEARSAALQLACTERFAWPLPTTRMDPCELMESILEWEGKAA